MLVSYVCFGGMVGISVVLYVLESVDPAVCALLVYLFVGFSMYERDKCLEKSKDEIEFEKWDKIMRPGR